MITRKAAQLAFFTLISALVGLAPSAASAGDRQSDALHESIGLARAIELAEAQVPGSSALEAEFEKKGGAFVFEVEVLDASYLTELTLSAADGSVLASKVKAKAQETHRDEVAEFEAVAAAQVDLEGAVRKAEEHTGGEASEAGLEAEEGSTAVYEIKVFASGRQLEVLVDPATGAVRNP